MENFDQFILDRRQWVEEYRKNESIMNLKVNLNDFSKIKTIGKGAYGDVGLYSNKETNQLYAIKNLIPAGNELQKIYSQLTFFREIQYTHDFAHPTIVPFFGCSYPSSSSSKGEYSFVTEYQENGSLTNLLKKLHSKDNPLYDETWFKTKRAKIAFGIAVGFMFIHNKGIIYRDLKPDNILISSNFEPKIADFGGARSNDNAVFTSKIGTPAYLAPEAIQEFPYSFPVDVFSYSLIMIQLFTFDELYKDKNSLQISNFIVDGNRPAIPEDVPEAMKQLIEASYSQSDQDRPTFTDIVENYLKDITAFFGDIDVAEFNEYKDRVFTGLLSPPDSQDSQPDPEMNDKILLNPPNLFESDLDNGNYTQDEIDPYDDDSYQAPNLLDNLRRVQYFILDEFDNDTDIDDRDYEKPFEIVRQIADESGNGYANLVTGYMLDNGLGCDEDKEAALAYYQKAIDSGQYPIAYYFSGKLQNTEEKQLDSYLLGADSFNEPNCCYEIGCIYEQKKEKEKSNLYYQKGAKLYHPEANYILGLHYFNECKYEEAVPYFTAAISISKHPEATMKYAEMLEKGLGVPKDIIEAKNYYRNIKSEMPKAQIRFQHLAYLEKPDNYKVLGQAKKILGKSKDPEAKFYLYEISHAEGEEEDADEYLQKAVEGKFPMAFYIKAQKEIESNDFQNARQHLKEAASSNLPEAMLLLGDLYLQGKLPPKKNKTLQECAIHHYNKAAKHSCPEGYYKLSMVYKEQGRFHHFLKNIKIAHDLGIRMATFEYASYLLSEQKIAESINILSQCQNLDQDDEINLLYAESLYRGKRFEDSIFIIDSLIAHENPCALFMKGLILKKFNPFKKSEEEIQEEAKALFERARSQHYYPAFALLGQIHIEKGEFEEGTQLLEQAYQNHSSDAAYYYGLYLLNHGDKEKGIQLLIEAAEHNQPCALKKLSEMYSTGDIVSKDEGKAQQYTKLYAKYNKEPIDLNSTTVSARIANLLREAFGPTQKSQALLELSRCYQNEIDCTKDLDKAASYIRLAAFDDKCPEAQFLYGKLLDAGQGVTRSHVMAYEWIEHAAERGYQPAIDYLQSMNSQ